MAGEFEVLSKADLNTLWAKIKSTFATKDVATTTTKGLMSAADKTKLDNISAGTVTSVKVGSTTYYPSDGVVSLPAYLPLTGGEIYNSNTNTPLTIKGPASQGACIKFTNPWSGASGSYDGIFGIDQDGYFKVDPRSTGTLYDVLHSGNSSVSKSGQTLTVKINGTELSLTNTNTWTAWAGATSSADGTAGYMPAPTSAQKDQFLRGDGTWVSLNNYSLPLAANGTRGGIQIGFSTSAANRNYAVALSSEKAYVNVPWTDRYVNSAAFADNTSGDANNPLKMTLTRAGSDTSTVVASLPKVSSSSAGVAPKGAAVSSQSQSTKFLREDGTWAAPSYTTNTNTWRPIKVSGEEKLGSGTSTGSIDFEPGTGTYLVWTASTKSIRYDLHFGNSANTACEGNDARLSDARPASDVYSWAKQSTKPSYSFSEITGTVSSSQLPSYVDDVLEYASKSNFPTTGESGKIYVALDTNLTWRWSGSAYVEISPSLALGETSSTAYRGDRGKTAYNHATDSSRLTTATASGLYKIAVTAEGHVASVTAVAKSDITALGIPGSNTTYSAGSGLSLSGTTFNHSNSVTAQTTQALYPIKIDAQGHISAYGTAVTSLPASDVYSWAKQSSLSMSLAASSSSGTVLSLSANTQYCLSAGGAAIYFNTPNDTTYSANNGVGLSGTTFYNSGVRAATINGNYLRINTNGTNADLTIPYATTAGSAPASDVYAWAKASTKPSYAFSEITGTVTNAQLAGSIANNKLANSSVSIAGTSVSLGGSISASTLQSNLGLGSAAYTASSTYATAGHTHTTSIATSSGTNQLTLAFGTKYAITAGGTSYVFTMPANPNSDVKVTQTVTTSSNTSWRPLILGDSYSDAATFAPSTVTSTTYATHLAKFAPSTGILAVVGLNKMGTDGKVVTGSNSAVFNTNGGTTSLATVATSGSYNDLSNKPTIPSVSNATITIKQTGISDQTFTLNGSATTITLADTNTWRPLGTGASDACAGNDSRLSNARPASDVSSWAKQSSLQMSFSSGSSPSPTSLAFGTQYALNAGGSALYFTMPALGTTGTTACAGNDSRLSDSRPASDVYAWAKASTKPSYSFSEIGSKPTTLSGYGITDGLYSTEVSAGQDNITWAKGIANNSATRRAFYYNTSGTEYSYLFGFSSSSASGGGANYGAVLKMGYNDTYLRILRVQGGTWKSSDWEKISAGYADSAGSVAWTNVSSRPTKLSQFTDDLGTSPTHTHSQYAVAANLGTASTHAHGDYVTAIGYDSTNKKITWSKGGTAQTAFTVGYASTAGSAPASDVYSWAKAASIGLDIHTSSSSGTVLSLAASTQYCLEAGGSAFYFTTPPNTTYESKAAASGGTAVSLVTTGEKYTWNNKQAAISDLTTIRSNASHGESAYNSLSNYLPLSGGTVGGGSTNNPLTIYGKASEGSFLKFACPWSGASGQYESTFGIDPDGKFLVMPNGSATAYNLLHTGNISDNASTIKTGLSLTKSDVGLGNVANSTYAGGTAVTLNGTSKASSTASFYAPTGAGTAGFALVSNGSGAPSWTGFRIQGGAVHNNNTSFSLNYTGSPHFDIVSPSGLEHHLVINSLPNPSDVTLWGVWQYIGIGGFECVKLPATGGSWNIFPFDNADMYVNSHQGPVVVKYMFVKIQQQGYDTNWLVFDIGNCMYED